MRKTHDIKILFFLLIRRSILCFILFSLFVNLFVNEIAITQQKKNETMHMENSLKLSGKY